VLYNSSCFLDKRTYEFTPRMFHLSCASGSFEVNEVLNPARCPEEEDLVSPFPFLQVDIYCVDQPGKQTNYTHYTSHHHLLPYNFSCHSVVTRGG